MKKTLILFLTVVLLGPLAGLFGNVQENSVNPQASGIVFFRTTDLKALDDFYIGRLGCNLWIDQGFCHIYRSGNLLFGFSQRDQADTDGMVTFFFPKREDIDRLYKEFNDIAEEPPKESSGARIYHFFARDPDGRTVEFQYFMDEIDWDFGQY